MSWAATRSLECREGSSASFKGLSMEASAVQLTRGHNASLPSTVHQQDRHITSPEVVSVAATARRRVAEGCVMSLQRPSDAG